MMKVSSHKSSHKLQKSSRVSPPGRKEVMKKHTMHSSSSMRISSSSRPPMKRLSPGMKRGLMPPSSKSVQSARMQSITSTQPRSVSRPSMHGSPVPMERMTSGLKRLKYDKRKMSPSPVRRPVPPAPAAVSAPPPFIDDRYLSVRPPDHSARYSPPPTRKKPRRSADRYDRSISPDMAHRADMPLRQEPRMAQNVNMPSHQAPPMHLRDHRDHIQSSIRDGRNDHFEMHERGRRGPSPAGIPSNHPKRPAPPQMKPIYEDPRAQRYRSPSPRYQAPIPEKNYTLSLHERFSSVVESTRTEPRIKYSREDLEKITIDIHRNLKAESPTLRRIVDPNDVKLVRRENEGHHPMFDRDEIKKSSRDMRDDMHYEKKPVSSSAPIYTTAHAANFRQVENYEITRHRFDPHQAAVIPASKRSLSDRWQNPDGRKEGVALDRDDREREYERQQQKRIMPDARRSKSRDQDFRSEKYAVPEVSRSRPAYPVPQHRMHSPPPMRSTAPMHHKEMAHVDARRKLTGKLMERDPSNGIRSEMRSRYPQQPEKRYPGSTSMRIEKRPERRSPGGMLPPKWKSRSRSRSRSREERNPVYSRRPDSYNKSDMPPPRNSNYYEHSRGSSDSYRGRGGSRPFRSPRGYRGRGFRGSMRGTFSSRSPRGGYRSSSSFRGRGAPRRPSMRIPY